MSLRSQLGMDWFDLGLHAAVTGVILIWIGAVNNPRDAMIGYSMATTGSLVLLGLRRHFGLRQLGQPGLTTGEVVVDRIAELEQRVTELEMDRARVLELEERLDFTERLFSRGAIEPPVVGRGDPP